MPHGLSHLLLSQASAFVATHLGLNFPQERWPELERGLRGAASELGYESVEEGVRHLVTTPVSKQAVHTLAAHLTIGETYFFREQTTLTIFSEQILPGLIAARRGQAQYLRLWSAGCCTGEEAYTLAILLCQAMPDLRDWNITLLGTDINPRFLEKAAQGVFNEWSFRATSADVKERYFQQTSEGLWEVIPRIKKIVKFSALNLAEEFSAAQQSSVNAMDVIFCRNVLIYFAPDAAKKIVGNFHRALSEGGWLIVSPAETSAPLFSEFATINYPGATLYRKEGKAAPTAALSLPEVLAPQPTWFNKDAAKTPVAKTPEEKTPALQLARACANQGNLREARQWCEKAIAQDKLDPIPYYLRATILQEEGARDEAIAALKRALYLNHEFVPAHFALGSLLRQQGKAKEANRHLTQALRLLQNSSQEDILPELEGMTAGRLSAIIEALLQGGTP